MADFGRRDLTGLDEQRLIEERSELETPIRESLEKATVPWTRFALNWRPST